MEPNYKINLKPKKEYAVKPREEGIFRPPGYNEKIPGLIPLEVGFSKPIDFDDIVYGRAGDVNSDFYRTLFRQRR